MTPPTWARGEWVLMVLVFTTAALLGTHRLVRGVRGPAQVQEPEARARRRSELEAPLGSVDQRDSPRATESAESVWDAVE